MEEKFLETIDSFEMSFTKSFTKENIYICKEDDCHYMMLTSYHILEVFVFVRSLVLIQLQGNMQKFSKTLVQMKFMKQEKIVNLYYIFKFRTHFV